MTRIIDLPIVLVEEILSRIPLTSMKAMRSTCKTWNALSKHQILDRIAIDARKTLWFMVMDSKLCSIKFHLQGIYDHASVEKISIFDQIVIRQVLHCDGLLLCLVKDKRCHVVWNPYIGQLRWIEPRNKFHPTDMYAFGYDNKNKNRNHKILRFLDVFDWSLHQFFEIYDFNSNSWRVLHVNPPPDYNITCGASLKGNTYFFAEKQNSTAFATEGLLFCFDFTTERFGPSLSLPFHYYVWGLETVALSCVKDEQLAVLLYHHSNNEITKIWITTKVEPNGVSWSNFLQVDMRQLPPYGTCFMGGTFFIDEEKKVVVVSHGVRLHIIGEDGYFKPVNIGQVREPRYEDFRQHVFSSYVPSLVNVQLQANKQVKRKERDYSYSY